MSLQNVGAMRIELTALDEDCKLEILSGPDIYSANTGTSFEGEKPHLLLKEISDDEIALRRFETVKSKISLVYGSKFYVGNNRKNKLEKRRAFSLKLKKREKIVFTKFVYFDTGKDCKGLKNRCLYELNKVSKKGFEKLLDSHILKWGKLWKIADINVHAPAEVQRAIRFSIYQLLICAPHEKPNGIGAKALTGEGYRGHSFWDTEIFTLPFYIHTNPAAAKLLLQYRYERLGQARKIARESGYKGCMFPWESADTGEEATPPWDRQKNGKIIPIRTGVQEHHITADIAYAIHQYYIATGDERFMLEFGLEMILECARFWASRAKYSTKEKRWRINNVIGPDEFHENVNNNAFTNKMAAWNLTTAADLHAHFKKRFHQETHKIEKKIKLKPEEVKNWKTIAETLADHFSKNGIIEQFDGFFRKRFHGNIRKDKYLLPLDSLKFELQYLNKTQLIKQADIMLMMYLHPGEYTLEQKVKNYEFYEKRTLHQSSLSPAIYAIAALEAGFASKAFKHFLASLFLDLKDLNKNVSHGVHIACCGAVYQTLLCGYGGVRPGTRTLSLSPRPPVQWKHMKYSFIWRKNLFSVEAGRKKINIQVHSGRRNPVVVEIYGQKRKLVPGRKYRFPVPGNYLSY